MIATLLVSGSAPPNGRLPFLETDPEPKLKLPGTGFGVRNQAGGGVGSPAGCQGGGAWKTKIGVIHDIEHFGSECHTSPFPHFKTLLQCEVHVLKPWSDNRISSQV